MKTAAIYCRVSSENQEREGSSLSSQLEACVRKAQDSGYVAPENRIVKEVYSGLTLDRQKLTELRQWARNREIEAVIVYSTDRLSRDPVHLLLLAEEFDKKEVPLIFVTEPMDNSMEGQLLSFVRGWASKLEVVRIAERTKRGILTRVQGKDKYDSPKMPGNSHARMYGYIYIRGKGEGEGVRAINEAEAKWVRSIFHWLVDEGLSCESIARRLRELEVPTYTGNAIWGYSTVNKMVKNPAYIGKTYAYTCTYGLPSYRLKPNPKRKNTGIIRKPKEEWIEIPGATPPIISEELFNAAQDRFREYRKNAKRNIKNEFLLNRHLYCKQCGRVFWGHTGIKPKNGKQYRYPLYYCSGKLRRVTEPTKSVRCHNKQQTAKRIEGLVWAEIEKILSEPELIFHEFEKRKGEQKTSLWEKDLEVVNNRLVHWEKEKKRFWRAFGITGDEQTFRENIALAQNEITQLQQGKAKLQRQIEETKLFNPDISDIKKACELVAKNLGSLSFEEKRLALDALQIKVWAGGDNITIQGIIPVPIVKKVQPTSTTAFRHQLLYLP